MNQYIKSYIIYLLTLLTLLIVFNWAVDPYGVHSHNIVPLEKKPAAQTHVRLSKPYLVTQIKPQTIILGSSRAAVGLNPDNPNFIHLPVFNMGIDGANMREIYYNFLHAYQVGNLKQVILALDFMSFNIHMEDKPDFSLKRLKTKKNKIAYETEMFSQYTSYQATKDSIKTLLNKFDPTLPVMNKSGLTLEDSLHTYQKIHGGHHNTTLISEKSYVNDVWLPPKVRGYNFNDESKSESTPIYLGKILSLCYEKNIKVTMFFSPTHIRHRVLISKIGLWDIYQNWKKKVIQENYTQAKQHSKQPYEIWDFTIINTMTTETFPAQGDANYKMTWYWESSHYKQQLGNLILDKILGQYNTDEVKVTIGKLVDIYNIDIQLNIEGKEYDKFILDNKDITTELSELIKNKYELS
tara:strand:+ start:34754 stop:35980 length:1227 start_codon:yes stop_codon:yes gene_type:complete